MTFTFFIKVAAIAYRTSWVGHDIELCIISCSVLLSLEKYFTEHFVGPTGFEPVILSVISRLLTAFQRWSRFQEVSLSQWLYSKSLLFCCQALLCVVKIRVRYFCVRIKHKDFSCKWRRTCERWIKILAITSAAVIWPNRSVGINKTPTMICLI